MKFKPGQKVKVIKEFRMHKELFPIGSIHEVKRHLSGNMGFIIDGKEYLNLIDYPYFWPWRHVELVTNHPKFEREEDYYKWLADRG